MNGPVTALLAAAAMAAAMTASAHPATELYIPIGKSPGISQLKSHIGLIQSVAAAQTGVTLAAPGGSRYIALGKATKIYVQHEDSSRANRLGTFADCRAGLMAEAYVADDGSVTWVKILVP